MPLTRYQIRNEYSLADPELYRAADKDDPEALLEGVAMAGLVGVLRQLGDLAEFAAEIFHDLHEEVMATAARGHGLMVRVQQLEADFPSVERAFLSQTSHTLFFSNPGVDWHPNLRMDQNLISQGDLPRFVMDSYEECRGPPRLFLLDKFDVAGAGACLKRYTDPSFFKVEVSSSGMTNAEIQREKKIRKAKKKGSRWRNGETPDILPASHAKLHQLFLEERVANGTTDPARRVKLKRRLNGFPFDSRTGKSYMEKFLKTPSPEHKVVHEVTVSSPPLKLPSHITNESGLEIVEISTASPHEEPLQRKRSPYSSPHIEETILESSMSELNEEVMDRISKVHNLSFEADNILSTLDEVVDEKEIAVDGESRTEDSRDSYQSDDIASEIDAYMDALTTMESEMETDTEYKAKNEVAILNIEKQGSDSDGNDKQELQPHFSDSQSLGNSIASDDVVNSSKKELSSFSCSDSLSNLAENTPLDVDVSAKVFPFTEICEAEVVNMSSDLQFVKEETPETQLTEHVVPSGPCVEIPNYRSEFGEPSSSSCLTDATPTLLPVDPGASWRECAVVEPELDEISSGCNEPAAEFICTEENTINMGDNLPCTPNLSDVPSQTRDDLLPMVSTENHPLDELDDEDPNVFSDASLHFLNISELSCEKKNSESSLDYVLQTEYSEDNCSKNLVDGQINSPPSVTSHTEEQALDSALPELENCNSDAKQGGIVPKVDDAIPLAGEITMNLTPVGDNPQACNVTEPQIMERTDDVSPSELDSAEVCISYSGEKNLDGAFSTTGGEETDVLSLSIDMVGNDAAPLEFAFDCPKSPDPAPDIKVHIPLNDIGTETAQSEAVAVDSAAASTDDDNDGENCVNYFSTNLTGSQEVPLSGLGDSNQNGLESHEACLPVHLKQSDGEKEVDQQAIASPEFDSIPCNKIFYDHSYAELIDDVSDSFMAADTENGSHPNDAAAVLSSSNQNGRDSKSLSLQQSNMIENSVDSLSSLTHYLAELRIPVEQKVELQATQLDKECPHAGEASSESSIQLEQIQPPNHLDHEICIDASSEFHPAHPPSQPSLSELLPQSICKKDISEQDSDPLISVFPAFGLFPEANQINLEEMPPLPPLPPVQWRTGKTQHASQASERDLVQNNMEPFPTSLPSTAYEKVQLGYPAVKGEITQPSNPFSPLSAAKDENSQHVYENLAGTMAHSNPFSFQVPTIVDHGNSHDDIHTSGRTQSMNPFLMLPSIYDERTQRGFLGLEGATVQPSLNPFSTVTSVEDTASTHASRSLQEKLIQPLDQLAPETGSCVISNVKVMNPPDTAVPPPATEEEQPHHVFQTSERETSWSSSISIPLTASEDGKANENRPIKLPRPRNPLIDAVAAHGKSKLRKVTERVRPQVEQKVDERDSLLEQIRTKSFNLKPAVVTRPSIQGPKTNLKVAAILEKANAIRQAFAGSDEDDDADSWSDS
ncbi:protein SCAR2 [Cornus florida]|uniref:protein SCAR2 n=1 Tax=Cornus florida TaxID=4283 RepID=UPI0028A0DC82|nr:protein SCAR2 [Cornus florida]